MGWDGFSRVAGWAMERTCWFGWGEGPDIDGDAVVCVRYTDFVLFIMQLMQK